MKIARDEEANVGIAGVTSRLDDEVRGRFSLLQISVNFKRFGYILPLTNENLENEEIIIKFDVENIAKKQKDRHDEE